MAERKLLIVKAGSHEPEVLAMALGLVIVPVLNKIDLPSAQPDVVIEELENVLAIPREEVILVSAKDGTNVEAVLEAVVERVPPPATGSLRRLSGEQLRALVGSEPAVAGEEVIHRILVVDAAAVFRLHAAHQRAAQDAG